MKCILAALLWRFIVILIVRENLINNNRKNTYISVTLKLWQALYKTKNSTVRLRVDSFQPVAHCSQVVKQIKCINEILGKCLARSSDLLSCMRLTSWQFRRTKGAAEIRFVLRFISRIVSKYKSCLFLFFCAGVRLWSHSCLINWKFQGRFTQAHLTLPFWSIFFFFFWAGRSWFKTSITLELHRIWVEVSKSRNFWHFHELLFLLSLILSNFKEQFWC